MPAPAQKLRPCISEILRTCTLPTLPTLRIEHITSTRAGKGDAVSKPVVDGADHASTLKAYLTDGHLTIQALLCQPSNQTRLTPGILLALIGFEVRRSRRVQASGHVVYLAIKSYEILGSERAVEEHSEGSFVRDGLAAASPSPVSPRKRSLSPERYFPDRVNTSTPTAHNEQAPFKRLRFEGLPPSSQLPSMSSPEASASDEEDHFETITPHCKTIERRRDALRVMQPESPLTRKTSIAPQLTDQEVGTIQKQSYSPTNDQTILKRSTQPSATQLRSLSDLPVHTLASLAHPHVRLPKSYQCTVFAIITWVSPNLITKPPFPPKRHVKIHDISTSNQWSGITLAVFVDAKDFTPELGTVALFRGVTMQKCGDEVILNAYKTLKDRSEDDEWLMDDVEWLEEQGWDVQGLKIWWSRRQQSRPGSRGSDKASTS